MRRYRSDYVFHPPVGGNVPGKVDANPYINYPPDDLRKMILDETNKEEKQKMLSAIKQWERIYVYPGYPYRAVKALRKIAAIMLKHAEVMNPAINVPYYQDSEVPQGYEEILDSLWGLYDNDNNERFDYNRQGERPIPDSEFNQGNFSMPKEGPLGIVVKPDGDGPSPADMDCPFPPTGGDIDIL